MVTSPTAAPATPLRQRMQQDMLMRGLGLHTQHDYVRHVRRFLFDVSLKRQDLSRALVIKGRTQQRLSSAYLPKSPVRDVSDAPLLILRRQRKMQRGKARSTKMLNTYASHHAGEDPRCCTVTEHHERILR